MKLELEADLSFALAEPCELMLQIEVAASRHQTVSKSNLTVLSGRELARIPSEEAIGNRIWLAAEDRIACRYSAMVELTRPATDLRKLKQVSLPSLPADVIKYLMPSRYCIPEDFHEFTASQFRDLSGGAAITAMRDWVEENFTYAIDASTIATDATASFKSRRGICRDYAHVLVAMARAISIPARFVSAYAPDVRPQDFHALAEVYLEDKWHLVDPTGMSKAEETAIIAVGRDAADTPFLTTFGSASFERQSVTVSRV